MEHRAHGASVGDPTYDMLKNGRHLVESPEYMDDDAVELRLFDILSQVEKLLLDAAPLCRGRPRLDVLASLLDQIDEDVALALDSLGK